MTSRSWSTLGVTPAFLAAALSVSSGAWSVAADEAIGSSSGDDELERDADLLAWLVVDEPPAE